MQLHENHSIKRAGVAGLRARGFRFNRGISTSILSRHDHFFRACRACPRRDETLRFVMIVSMCHVAGRQSEALRRSDGVAGTALRAKYSAL